jgi:hypothetical protein
VSPYCLASGPVRTFIATIPTTRITPTRGGGQPGGVKLRAHSKLHLLGWGVNHKMMSNDKGARREDGVVKSFVSCNTLYSLCLTGDFVVPRPSLPPLT